jgi:Ca2+-binding EF-hand superfamily protein
MMLPRLAAAPVLLAALAALLPAEPPSGAGPAEGSVREIAYFGRGGPVRLHLQIQIDGRSADAVWKEAVDALFAFCDKNGDGELDAAELAIFARPQTEPPDPLRVQLAFPSRNRKVTRAEFAALLRDAGCEAVNLKFISGRSDSDQLSATLFRHLDQDGDGKLSVSELKAARERLAFLDLNEDELLSAAELLGRAVAVQPNANVSVLANLPSREASPEVRMLAGDSAAMAQQLIAGAGSARATALRRADLGADEKTFAALDVNRDGKLDLAEVEQWLRRPPNWSRAFSFGRGKGPGQENQAPLRGEAGAATELALPQVRFRYEPPSEGMPDTRTAWAQKVEAVRGQLKSLADADGAVARKQLTEPPSPLLAFFDFADRNGDVRLDPAELDAALAVLDRAAACLVNVTIQDQGGGLFELLDRNGDGQLSPRELLEAASTLQPFADAAGNVRPDALPRRFIIRVAAGSIPLGLSPVPSSPLMSGAPARPAPPAVPRWFLQMDRNGDGDVSLREFLGPLATATGSLVRTRPGRPKRPRAQLRVRPK